jgi:hypothetical protein
MRYFFALLAACVASLATYFLLFGFLVSRPLVVDQIRQFMDKKLAYADATGHPKIFVVAGSNARFSHSCAVLEAKLKRPCVNMGIAADVSLDWTLEMVRSRLGPGDLVYLPLEYGVYSRSRARLMTGMDAAYRFRHDKASLKERGAEGVMRAAFMFSLPTLVQSVGEMGLKAAGVRRRFNLDTLDRQGDEIGHDGDSARAYRHVIESAPQELPDPAHLLDDPDGAQAVLARFLDWCRTHQVVTVGGLPTVFDDRPVPDAALSQLRTLYANHGGRFIALPSRSQYPRDAFYDTGYHLRESFQRRHSEALASALGPLLPPR